MHRTVRSCVPAFVLLAACSGRSSCSYGPSGAISNPSTVEAPPAASPSYAIHEWGLLAIEAGQSRGMAGTEVLRPTHHAYGLGNGLGTLGGKPVLYVHLDEGVSSIRFSISIDVGGTARVDEHWPPGTVAGPLLTFGDVLANRGACAVRTPPPTGDSAACRTTDGFCEAAEIPRYEADHDVCLTLGESFTDLLFYRASGFDLSGLPIAMSGGPVADAPLALEQRSEPLPDGPVYLLERRFGEPVIRRVSAADALGPFAREVGEVVTPAEVRADLLAGARLRGLTEAEAEAFVDAWSPAFFDTCRRTGPEAHGTAPTALAEVDRSVLYFARRPFVDVALPLRATPTPRAIERVFLVRLVDPTSRPTPAEPGSYGRSELAIDTPPSEMRFVRVGRPIAVQGGLTSDQVRRVVQRNLSQLQYCYEQGLRRTPGLEGSTVLTFEIRASGSVGSSSASAERLPDEGVLRCMAAVARRLQFPVAEPVGPVIVHLPLTLAPRSSR